MIHKDEEAKDMIHKDKEAKEMTNDDDVATEHDTTKFIHNHATETKSKSIMWQRKLKEKLTPNSYYSFGLANKKRLQGKKKKKKGDTTPLSSTFVLAPAAA